MMIRVGVLLLCCMVTSTWALDRWNFTQKLAISGTPKTGIFHHLDGAGRKHIAVNEKYVAVTWEDDHSGDPQVYVAFLKRPGDAFPKHFRSVRVRKPMSPRLHPWIKNDLSRPGNRMDRFGLVWFNPLNTVNP